MIAPMETQTHRQRNRRPRTTWPMSPLSKFALLSLTSVGSVTRFGSLPAIPNRCVGQTDQQIFSTNATDRRPNRISPTPTLVCGLLSVRPVSDQYPAHDNLVFALIRFWNVRKHNFNMCFCPMCHHNPSVSFTSRPSHKTTQKHNQKPQGQQPANITTNTHTHNKRPTLQELTNIMNHKDIFGAMSSVNPTNASTNVNASNTENDNHRGKRESRFIEHKYVDRALMHVENDTTPACRGGIKTPFPRRLHEVLNEIEREGYEAVVSWQPHGRCFIIHQPRLFDQIVMPKYFGQSKFSSFQRQLNLYGFNRITQGLDRGGYYHEAFLRGKPALTRFVERRRVKGTTIRGKANPDNEPNFYAMPFLDRDGNVHSVNDQCHHHQRRRRREMSQSQHRGTTTMTASLNPPFMADTTNNPSANIRTSLATIRNNNDRNSHNNRIDICESNFNSSLPSLQSMENLSDAVDMSDDSGGSDMESDSHSVQSLHLMQTVQHGDINDTVRDSLRSALDMDDLNLLLNGGSSGSDNSSGSNNQSEAVDENNDDSMDFEGRQFFPVVDDTSLNSIPL